MVCKQFRILMRNKYKSRPPATEIWNNKVPIQALDAT